MQQVIINLVRNAIDAVRAEGGSIVAETGQDDGWVTLSVSDDGPGVAAEVADAIFDAFVTTKSDGLGLGLAVSKLLVEAHGGTIGARPNAPRGTTVTIRLPADPAR